jgi:hypothetical protein
MKPLALIVIFLAIDHPIMAVEYVTIRKDGETITTNATDIIEVVGLPSTTGSTGSWGVYKTVEGTEQFWHLRNEPRQWLGTTETGITRIRFFKGNSPDGDGITLKITNASEVNKVGPTSVLLLPENSQGNYDLLIESSLDCNSWLAFHSQTVASNTAKRFFRVRITPRPLVAPVE